MIKDPQYLLNRSQLLNAIRNFFSSKNIIELDTPFLKKNGGMEPYLDPFKVNSPFGEEGYLITSPEYSLKEAISILRNQAIAGVYELAHAFRSGEKGELHTKEFLMLEFYIINRTEIDLIHLCIDLFLTLNKVFSKNIFIPENSQIITMKELFIQKTSRGYSRKELLETVKENNLSAHDNDRYDDLFFIVFLNLIEPTFTEGPLFITEWPEKLAALAKIENGVARRVEIYWQSVELGNGFYELNDDNEQRKRFREEQQLRKSLNKEVFAIDEDFLSSLKLLPDCAGISIGIDRLLMIFTESNSLKDISPYFINLQSD